MRRCDGGPTTKDDGRYKSTTILRLRPKVCSRPVTWNSTAAPRLPTIQDGQALAKANNLSVDPTMRVWMAVDTYLPAVAIGEVMRAIGLAEVWSRATKSSRRRQSRRLTGLQDYWSSIPGQARRPRKFRQFHHPKYALILAPARPGKRVGKKELAELSGGRRACPESMTQYPASPVRPRLVALLNSLCATPPLGQADCAHDFADGDGRQ